MSARRNEAPQQNDGAPRLSHDPRSRQGVAVAVSHSKINLISSTVPWPLILFGLWVMTATFPITYPNSGTRRSIDGELSKGPRLSSLLTDPSGYMMGIPNTGQTSGANELIYFDVILNGVPRAAALTFALWVQNHAHASFGLRSFTLLATLIPQSGSFAYCLCLYSCCTWAAVFVECFRTVNGMPFLRAAHLCAEQDLHSAFFPYFPFFMFWNESSGNTASHPVHFLVCVMRTIMPHQNERGQGDFYHLLRQDRDHSPQVGQGPVRSQTGLAQALGNPATSHDYDFSERDPRCEPRPDWTPPEWLRLPGVDP